MQKVTYDMLTGLGPVIQSAFRMLYPMGLTMDSIEERAEQYTWMRLIRDYIREAKQ